MRADVFKESFKAMYADIWNALSPWLWKDSISDEEWGVIIGTANEVTEKHTSMGRYAIDLSTCLLNAIERRHKERG